jgi:hypothetical protein
MQPQDPKSHVCEEVLILETPDWNETEEIVRRVQTAGARVTIVPDLDEAERLLGAHDHDFGAVLIPTSIGSDVLRKRIKGLRAQSRSRALTFLSTGPAPTRQERRRLRKAGMNLALWHPTNDAAFRFQINRALNPDTVNLSKRANPRVPTQLHCRVRFGDREKETSVYSLSTTGAFLETERASMSGGHVHLDIKVMDHIIQTRGTVVFSNVPGNLQKPSLPLGMAVRFESLSNDHRKKLAAYVEHLLGELTV